MSRLSLRLAVAVLAFVVAGSLALVFWMGAEERRQSRELFAATAKANADFVRTGAPLTERTELSLSEVLGVDVYFFWDGERFNRKPDGLQSRVIVAASKAGGVVVSLHGYEGVAVALKPGFFLALVRPVPPLGALSSMRTYAVLAAFWLFSLALATALARGILGQAERLATLGRMATGLAHEINNPVAAIKLHAQLLESDGPSESLTAILGENAKIEALVNQWMFLARPQPPAVAPCDLAGLLAECIRTVAPAAAHASVRVTSEVTSIVASVDRRRVAQAFVNVMTNAIHAMVGGGELRITNTGATLVFRDTGPGFSAAALARATELFYSEKEGGMGIGLSVTTEILKAHGGTLHLANGERGAVVTLSFLANL